MQVLRLFPRLMVVLLTSLLPATAHANPIVGTIGFVVNGDISPNSGSLNPAFSLTTVVTNNSATGNWTPFLGGTAVASTMNFGAFSSVGSSFSFSDASFGSFVGIVQFDSGQTGNSIVALRQISINGTFTPGPTLTGYTSPGLGELNLVIQSITGGARSTSLIFETTAVPEPGTLALACLGVSLIGARARWNKEKQRNGK